MDCGIGPHVLANLMQLASPGEVNCIKNCIKFAEGTDG